jgi:hypothetical protein
LGINRRNYSLVHLLLFITIHHPSHDKNLDIPAVRQSFLPPSPQITIMLSTEYVFKYLFHLYELTLTAIYRLPRIRACLFDMDGLLLNTEDIYTTITNSVLQEYGKPNMPWTLKAQIQGRPAPEVRLPLPPKKEPVRNIHLQTYRPPKSSMTGQAYPSHKTSTPPK